MPLLADRYTITVYHYLEVPTSPDENGNEWIVFIRDWNNPLQSLWSYWPTKESANKRADQYRKEILKTQ